VLWQPLVITTNNNTSNKSLNRISSGNHKRTRQEVSTELLSYLYKLHMVHTTNNYSCPNVHVLSMSAPCIHHEVVIQLICSLMSSVMNLFLRVGNKNNSCIRETQENSIEFLVQSSLPYILIPMVRASYCAPYPKQP